MKTVREVLTEEQIAILDHTLSRAPKRRYCGNSSDMKRLVDLGLMRSLGKPIWALDEYFTITTKGCVMFAAAKEQKRKQSNPVNFTG